MALTVDATKQDLADAFKALGGYVSLHTADPGSTGASEATGGTPAYARQQTTWTSGTTGSVTGSQVTIDVPAGTYSYVGLWSAATSGDFIAGYQLGSAVTLADQGQVKVTPSYTQS